ncbi:MAG TPA: DUF4251 domain-containing protein [Chitinophagaceae bacterium]|nr:DUF4251 domain-containing protein [Chitinophagaceae bacterium]
MKLFQTLVKIVIPAVIFCTPVAAQTTSTKALIESGRFIFKAQTVSPAYGNLRQLTPDYYTLSISKDTLVADLPYFGRAFSAPVDPTQGGLNFTATDFDYLVKNGKKAWNISIKTRRPGDAVQFYLTVFDNGTAYLQVNSINRQPISFNGIIEAAK